MADYIQNAEEFAEEICLNCKNQNFSKDDWLDISIEMSMHDFFNNGMVHI